MSYERCEPLNLNVIIINEDQNTANCEITSSLDLAEQFEGSGSKLSINDLQKLLLETKKQSILDRDILLPEGKDAHFFISYSSEDRSTVLPIIAELEQRHRVACIFDERDFISGMKIHENIKRSMELSMKVLLFLSKSFLDSGYCQYENDLAFAMSMRTGQNIIIPVKLDECEVPSTLETLSYIAVDNDNLTGRIVEAYNSTKRDFLPDDFGPARNVENGCSIILPRATLPTSSFKLIPNTKIVLDDETRQMLNHGKFKVSEETVQAAVATANKFISPDRWARSTPRVMFGLWLGDSILVMGALYVTFLMNHIVVGERRFSKEAEDVNQNRTGVWIVILIINVVLGLGTVLYYSHRRKLDKIMLKDALFNNFTLKTYRDGVLFKVSVETYLARKMKQHVEENYNGEHPYSMDEYEDVADEFIRQRLYAYTYKYVPDAPVNRHSVKGGRSCLCQVFEPIVGKFVLAWISKSAAQQIEEV